MNGDLSYPAESDVEGCGTADSDDTEQTAAARQVLRWRGRNEAVVTTNSKDISPGDVVVIPAKLGGWEELATDGSPTFIADFGDRAFAQSRNKALLRMHPDVIRQLPQTEALKHLYEVVVDGPVLFEKDPEIDNLINCYYGQDHKRKQDAQRYRPCQKAKPQTGFALRYLTFRC